MKKFFLLICMIVAAMLMSLSAWADYECEVKVKIDTMPETQASGDYGQYHWWSEHGVSWSKDIPKFSTSGVESFGREAIVLGMNPNVFFNDVPTRVEKCMLDAAEQLFGNLEKIWSHEGGYVAGYTASNENLFIDLLNQSGNPNLEYGYCSGNRRGMTLKFSARKISNKNKWHHEYGIIYPKSQTMEGGFCKKYFEPPCPMPVPSTTTSGIVEDDLSGQAIVDLFEDETSFEDETPSATSTPEGWTEPEQAPPCVLAPYTLKGLNAVVTSHNAAASWVDMGTMLGVAPRRLKVGDLTGDGRDDILLPNDGTVISFMPSANFHKNCGDYKDSLAGQGKPASSGAFSINAPAALNKTPFCIDRTDLPIDENGLKIADVTGNDTQEIVNITKPQWTYFIPSTGQWTPLTPSKQNVVSYLPQSGQTDPTVTLPKPADYWTQLNVIRTRPDFVDFGIFYADRKEDAFLVYDNKWWVNNNAVSTWQLTADLNNIVPENMSDAVIGDKSGVNTGMNGVIKQKITAKIVTNKSKQKLIKPMPSLSTIKDPNTSSAPFSFGKVLAKASNLKLGDFTGDGISDVFTTVSGRWVLFPSAGHEYRVLRVSNKPLSDLQFGDFNGDGVMDVFEKDGDKWQYYSKGQGQPNALLSSDQDVQDLRPFYGDTDKKSDVLSSTFTIPEGWSFPTVN